MKQEKKYKLAGPELEYLAAAIENLKTYLISDVLFWPLGLKTRLENGGISNELTLGNVLFARQKLRSASLAGRLDDSHEHDLQGLEKKLEGLADRWQTAWEKKALREFQARLRQWAFYLGELSENPDLHRPSYASEIRNRVVLELLRDQQPGGAAGEVQNLLRLDARLADHLEAGDFLWDRALEPGFPEKQYWFLYRAIRERQVDIQTGR